MTNCKFICMTGIVDNKPRFYNINKLDIITILKSDQMEATILVAFDWDDAVGAIPDENRTYIVRKSDLYGLVVGM